MLIRNKLSMMLVVVGTLLVGTFLFSHHASAAFTLCDVLAPHADNSANSSDCFGVTENAMDGVSSVSSLESRIKEYYDYGGYQRVGAQYIANGLGNSGGSSWEVRLSQPGVTVTTGSYSTCTNTGYDTSSKQVVTYGGDCGTFASVLIELNGVIKYAIKIDCGNPLGNLPGLPAYSPNSQPTGTLSAVCFQDASGIDYYKFHATFSDADGSTVGHLGHGSTVLYGLNDGHGDKDFGSPKDITFYHSDARMTNNADWPVAIDVEDVGPAGSHTFKNVAQVDRPDCPPQWTNGGVPVANATCTTISGGAYDIDDPNDQIRIDIYENGQTWPTYDQYTLHTSGPSHSFSVSIADVIAGNLGHAGAPVAYGPQTFYVAAIGVNSAGTETTHIWSNPITVGPCQHATCDVASTLPGTMIVGQEQWFDVSVDLSYPWASPPYTGYPSWPYNPQLWVTLRGPGDVVIPLQENPDLGPPYSSGGMVPYNANQPPDGLTIRSVKLGFTPTVPGNYYVQWQLGGAVTTGTCGYTGGPTNGPNIGQAYYGPYFQTKGGDVAAGAGFMSGATACTQDNTAVIEGWNDDAGSPTDYNGAGSSLAAFALSNIKSFVTGQSNALASNPASSYALSFANSGTIPSPDGKGNYGGQFGSLPCLPDYASQVTSTTPWTDNLTTSGAYQSNGPVTVAGAGDVTLQPDTVVTLKVDGDVFIAHNIDYNDSGGPGHYPRLNIVATGSIYVASTVTNLHGLFVAQGTADPSSLTSSNTSVVPPGTFVSCATANAGRTEFTEAADVNTCNSQLSVYGAVSAKQLALSRTFGNFATNTGPAETFTFSPELWLTTPECTAIPTDPTCAGGTNTPGWDAVVNLPPTL